MPRKHWIHTFTHGEETVTRKKLELLLEKTPGYTRPKERLEQYITPASIAASLLWEAFVRGDIEGKTVLDMGCGTFRLGIGALVLGAEKALGIDIDLEPLMTTYSYLGPDPRYTLIHGDARYAELSGIDTVVMNPPFGVKPWNRGIDIAFLEKALATAGAVYSLHKYSPGLDRIVYELAHRYGFSVESLRYLFPIKMTYIHHRRRLYRVDTVLYILRKR